MLVVDDERSMLVVLERHLRRVGFRAICVETATLALRILETWPVSVVIADLRMPDLDGLALLEQVGSRWPGVGRILLSGAASHLADECARSGIVLVEKAHPFKELLEELWFLTGRSADA